MMGDENIHCNTCVESVKFSEIVLILSMFSKYFVAVSVKELFDKKFRYRTQIRVSIKVKVHTLDIAPIRSESSPQKRSGMVRVLEGFHPTRSSAIGMSHTCLCLLSRNWYSFTDPEGWKALLFDDRAKFDRFCHPFPFGDA